MVASDDELKLFFEIGAFKAEKPVVSWDYVLI